ncbi:peroxisomal copper amine oxidase [Gymnopus androsaceus JB14]|uniref:Amine oxidase n=1 Tax=Gymnopus androsaceus JB14 TaxID=1447944 RepID=A0A6A4HCL5_9AGAR|nr:peroxisomal copper amine oxidase [Gymnopus androsaceus JB14]
MSTPIIPATATTTQELPHILHTVFKHPLDPLTPDEIVAVTLTVRHHITSKAEFESIKAIKFITTYLLPPPKKAVLAYLGIPLAPGEKAEPPAKIVRRAEVDCEYFLDVVNGVAYNVILSLHAEGKWSVDTIEQLPEGVQPQISVEELIACEKVVKADKKIQELAKEVGVLPDQIFCDGWSIGYDERFPQKRRVQQALIFARFSEHDNLYAHPMDFIPVVDANTGEVLQIDFPPHYKSTTNGHVLSVPKTHMPPLSDVAEAFKISNRERIPPPKKAFDFLPDLMAETEEVLGPAGSEAKEKKPFKYRDDIKPLHVLQPEGVSFKMNGHELEWQNWKMHIAYGQREGIILSTVTYNDHGEVRPIIYRLSLVEMVVPYGAPEYPHPRKFAFDSGEYGMGTMANELALGCDCVGQIHYLPGSYVSHSGTATVIKNVICIHEEDNGVLWKHTDYRPGGRSQTTRRRRLVVSMVCTLANYEYIWNYFFYQDGSIEIEARLTGILQVYAQQPGEPNPFGTTVAPGINAHYHQHLFSFRIDPMVDGIKNKVIEQDIIPLSGEQSATGEDLNFAGNAFTTTETVLENESGREYDFMKERRWRITNSARKHYASGKDVGYSVSLKGGITPMMARNDGWALRRAGFTKYPLWVVKDVEGPKGSRMWPARKYVPQTREQPKDSITSWVEGGLPVKDEDLLVYMTVGTTHVPRPEDWPVMPVEHLNIAIKPQSFFDKNPSMDVPGTNDGKSVSAFSDQSSSDACCN